MGDVCMARSMALKRKQHAEREEQHRQLVLEQRRQQLNEATNKFQRLGRRQASNSNYNNHNYDNRLAGLWNVIKIIGSL